MDLEVDKNEEHWPLVILTLKGNIKNDKTFENLLESWTKMYVRSSETKQRFRLLIDARQTLNIDTSCGMVMGKFLKQVKSLTEQWMEKTAILVESKLINFILKIVLMFYQPVRPFKIFGDDKEAGIWVLNDESGQEKDI